MKSRGFSLIELLFVLVAIGFLTYKANQYISKKQTVQAYNEVKQLDAAALEMMSLAVDRWMSMNVDAIADNTTIEVPVSSAAYRNLLPPGFDFNQLPSGLEIRAFVRKSESYPGSGIQIPRGVIVARN